MPAGRVRSGRIQDDKVGPEIAAVIPEFEPESLSVIIGYGILEPDYSHITGALELGPAVIFESSRYLIALNPGCFELIGYGQTCPNGCGIIVGRHDSIARKQQETAPCDKGNRPPMPRELEQHDQHEEGNERKHIPVESESDQRAGQDKRRITERENSEYGQGGAVAGMQISAPVSERSDNQTQDAQIDQANR